MKTRKYYDAYAMAQYILDNHNMSWQDMALEKN